MSSEQDKTEREGHHHPAHDLGRDDAQDRIISALAHLRGVLLQRGETYWKDNTYRQKAPLQEWAKSLDLLLEADAIIPLLIRGGQEHDIYEDEPSQRIVKVTRNGTFGLTPGIELDLVAQGEDGRRLHLWEASPYLYLERLHLQNLLIPGLNTLEGIIVHPTAMEVNELAIVISQPRFDIIPVTEKEIDVWFATQGFQKIAAASYYRKEDNLGVFDAHDKNVLRSHLDPDILIPFDVIPCHPEEGFLSFIEKALAENIPLHTQRSTHTSDRKSS